MQTKTKKLSNREIQFLDQIAQDANYKDLMEYFGVSAANVHVTCYNIRHKTGIRETRDPAECKRFLRTLPARDVEDAINDIKKPTFRKDLTPRHREVLHMLAQGLTPRDIAQKLRITIQTVQNTASTAVKRAGISHNGYNRQKVIVQWLRREQGMDEPAPTTSGNPMADPMF